MITGRDLISSYYEEDEKLFSTGNEELDDILEEVYYSGLEDGYDYAQKEFSSKLKLGTRMQNSILSRKKLSSDQALKEYQDAIDKERAKGKDADPDEIEAYQSYIDGVMLKRGKMTEDEFIAKHPWAAKKKYRK